MYLYFYLYFICVARNMKMLLQNSAIPSSRGRLPYIHPVVRCLLCLVCICLHTCICIFTCICICVASNMCSVETSYGEWTQFYFCVYICVFVFLYLCEWKFPMVSICRGRSHTACTQASSENLPHPNKPNKTTVIIIV